MGAVRRGARMAAPGGLMRSVYALAYMQGKDVEIPSTKAAANEAALDSKEIALRDRFRFEVGPPFVTTQKEAVP
jgi:hypothetical protein